MMNEFTGIQHPTHKRKAAIRKRKARSLKRSRALAKKTGRSTIHTNTKENS